MTFSSLIPSFLSRGLLLGIGYQFPLSFSSFSTYISLSLTINLLNNPSKNLHQPHLLLPLYIRKKFLYCLFYCLFFASLKFFLTQFPSSHFSPRFYSEFYPLFNYILDTIFFYYPQEIYYVSIRALYKTLNFSIQ